MVWDETTLDELLTTPSRQLVEDMARIQGDILILGAGGKMGPSLAVLARRAADAAGIPKRILAVSRFNDSAAASWLKECGVEMIEADLLKPGTLDRLPDTPNILYMAGRKFGTQGQEPLTWAMNARLPTLVAERYARSSIVVFSSGNIYPMMLESSGGATEDTPPAPVGEYAMSCLARERLFEYGSLANGTRVFLFRLNYAVDLRYGVLSDIARKVYEGTPIALNTPAFNCIWQGAANEIALRALLRAGSPAVRMNVTGPEILRVRETAHALGALLGRDPIFTGEEDASMLLSNAARALQVFGPPAVTAETLIRWQAQWILEGGRTLGKPTHFEQREGVY